MRKARWALAPAVRGGGFDYHRHREILSKGSEKALGMASCSLFEHQMGNCFLVKEERARVTVVCVGELPMPMIR